MPINTCIHYVVLLWSRHPVICLAICCSWPVTSSHTRIHAESVYNYLNHTCMNLPTCCTCSPKGVLHIYIYLPASLGLHRMETHPDIHISTRFYVWYYLWYLSMVWPLLDLPNIDVAAPVSGHVLFHIVIILIIIHACTAVRIDGKYHIVACCSYQLLLDDMSANTYADPWCDAFILHRPTKPKYYVSSIIMAHRRDDYVGVATSWIIIPCARFFSLWTRHVVIVGFWLTS